MVNFYNSDSNDISGYMGASSTLMGAFGTLFYGVMVGKFGPNSNKKFSSLINCFCSLSIILIILLIQCQLVNNYSIFVLLLILGFHADAFFSLGFELMANISYPTQPNVSANAALLIGNMLGAILIPVFGLLENKYKYLVTLIFTASTYFLSGLVLICVRLHNKRLEAEN
ncbi:hypothetical protein MXB_1272 [Myxobolus squamalis]|nr:hypothetical protein MXB_1272 [Myxobolus squamalis]